MEQGPDNFPCFTGRRCDRMLIASPHIHFRFRLSSQAEHCQ